MHETTICVQAHLQAPGIIILHDYTFYGIANIRRSTIRGVPVPNPNVFFMRFILFKKQNNLTRFMYLGLVCSIWT